MEIIEIARLCHEANRAICEAAGDHSQANWEGAEQWQRDSAVKGVQYAITFPDATPEDQHTAWMQDKIADGWGYGPIKDAESKTHPCIVPYGDLSFEQRVKDYVFKAIVRAMVA